MIKIFVFAGAAMLLPTACLAQRMAQSMNASITGGSGDGKCTIEASVDETAEVVISGTRANIRTLSGQTATLRRFQCNQPMPRNPANFRFRGIDGRGRQNLLGDPNGNGGRVIVRLDDPQNGREGYTFDLEWSGTSNSGYVPNDQYPDGYYPDDRNSGGYNPYPGGVYRNEKGKWKDKGNWDSSEAVQACQAEVLGRMERDGYRNPRIESGRVDDGKGKNDLVVGTAVGRRGFSGLGSGSRVNYECNVNLANGRLRNVRLSQQ